MQNSTIHVLVVDDEQPIRRFLRTVLEAHYKVFEAGTGMDALQTAAEIQPVLILLDLGLPDIDGFEVTRRLRKWTHVPIIILSVYDRETDKVAALDAGADDYLTKPFNVNELTARMRAALRHYSSPEIESLYKGDGLAVNLTRREVLVGGKQISLTPTEYDILRFLISHVGRVITHQQLIVSVWGENSETNAHLLRVNVSNLRKKIESDPFRPKQIVTEPGVGYRLIKVEDSLPNQI